MRSLPFTFQWQVSSGGEGAQGLLKEVGEEVAQEFICLYVYLRDDIERKECFLSGIAQITSLRIPCHVRYSVSQLCFQFKNESQQKYL